jgi:hypothetical protein
MSYLPEEVPEQGRHRRVHPLGCVTGFGGGHMTAERVVRQLGAMIVLTAAAVLAMPASAQTWQVEATLKYGSSPDICAEYEPSNYTLEFVGVVITGTGRSGKLFSTNVPASGVIRHVFKSGWGDAFEIYGNVRLRQLELIHMNSGCRWILDPVTR